MALVENLEAMLARGQDSALLRYGLGGEYLKLGQHDRAIEHLRRAVEMDPAYSAAWKLLGQALAGAQRRGEAVEAYERGIRAAEEKGDKQAAKEMEVFLKRLRKSQSE
jgi:tetratricopeptide (TPR) repeat protein